MRAPWPLLWLACGLAACSGGLWSAGLPDDGPAADSVVPNGVVLATGPAAWQAAAQRTAQRWTDLLPLGLIFDSVPVTSRGSGSLQVPPAALPHWAAAVVRPGHVSLDVGPQGLTLGVDVTLEPVTVTLEADDGAACTLEIAIPDGRLTGTLTLTKSKLGVVNLSPVGEATLREGDAEVTVSACREPHASRLGAADGPEVLALAALAEAAFSALTPSISASLPQGLGLDLAGATTVSYEDAGLGTGWQHTVVRAPLVAPSPWWQFASGRLVVPYSVGVTAERHACVPDEPLPVPMSAAVPTVDSEWALLVNQQVIARQVAATWRAGGLCGDRVVGALTWSAGAWAGGWPALNRLDADMEISARVWPESAPKVAFTAAEGRPHIVAHVDAGTWSVELMGWREDARVRLATVRVAISVRAAVVVEPTGEIWLSAEEIDVALADSEAGLLAPPSDESAAAHLDAIVRGALEATPVWVVPAIPAGVTPTVELQGSYLIIRDA